MRVNEKIDLLKLHTMALEGEAHEAARWAIGILEKLYAKKQEKYLRRTGNRGRPSVAYDDENRPLYTCVIKKYNNNTQIMINDKVAILFSYGVPVAGIAADGRKFYVDELTPVQRKHQLRFLNHADPDTLLEIAKRVNVDQLRTAQADVNQELPLVKNYHGKMKEDLFWSITFPFDGAEI